MVKITHEYRCSFLLQKASKRRYIDYRTLWVITQFQPSTFCHTCFIQPTYFFRSILKQTQQKSLQSQHIRNKASFFFRIGKTKYIKKIYPPTYNFYIDIVYYIHIVYEFIYSYSLSQHQRLLFQLKSIVLLLHPWNTENTGCPSPQEDRNAFFSFSIST